MTTATINTAREQTQDIFERVDGGAGVRLNFHAAQWKAWDSTARIVLVLAGTQGGKTSFGPHWLMREMIARGAGDYIAVAPTFPLMNKKMLPEFKRVFESTFKLGKYVGGSEKVFRLSRAGELFLFGEHQEEQTRIYFGHAQDADSLESATAKAAWLDEAGQKKFKLDSFDAIMRRLSIHRGRVLITTTPYYHGWLKKRVFDVWKNEGTSADIEVVQFRSTANPAFPKESDEEARRVLPDWKYRMFYLAQFTKPAGMIYSDFDEQLHVVKPFVLENRLESFTIFAGIDFGGVNTAAVLIARDNDSGDLYLFAEYHAGDRTSKQHAQAIDAHAQTQFADSESEKDDVKKMRRRVVAFGGAKSEGQWRREFAAGGLKIREPKVADVEIGIDRVTAVLKTNRLFIFDTCQRVIDEFNSYSRPLDENNEPTEGIENKSDYHLLDALRYVIPSAARGAGLIAW